MALRLSPRDRCLTRDERRRAADRLASRFGAEIWTTVGHGNDHVHLLWSRIRRDGTLVDHRYDRRRAEMLTREIELDLGLEPVRCSWQLDSRRSPAAARAVRREAPESAARRAAAWDAWQASEAGATNFLKELNQRTVRLTFNEELEFCVDLGDGRCEPLVRFLARCARRDGRRPPRERQVLAGIKGMCLGTLSAPRDEEQLDAAPPVSAAPSPAIADAFSQSTSRMPSPALNNPSLSDQSCVPLPATEQVSQDASGNIKTVVEHVLKNKHSHKSQIPKRILSNIKL